MDWLFSIVAFIVGIALLIGFHEFGHFWVAKKCGVKILRFSLGFGKPIYKWIGRDEDKTEFVLACIPLGGYVKMLDEREGPVPENQLDRAFNRKPLSSRFAIVAAGPIFNLGLAIILFWCSMMGGIPGLAPLIGDIKPHSWAQEAGLKTGQEIIRINNTPTETWQAVVNTLLPYMGDTQGELNIEVKDKEGHHTNHKLILNMWHMGKEPDILGSLGLFPKAPPLPPIVGSVIPDQPASKVGLQALDEIVRVNHVAITSWQQVVDIIHHSANKSLTIEVKRAGEHYLFTIVPGAKMDDKNNEIGYAGLVVQVPTHVPEEYLRTTYYSPLSAFTAASTKTWEYSTLTLLMLKKMIIGQVGLEHVSGPISIATSAGQMAHSGWTYYLSFLAIISISLGVLNLLPIPILDGGHLFYYLIEAIRGKPVSEKGQAFGFKIGAVLLLGLMCVAFYNDILRLL